MMQATLLAARVFFERPQLAGSLFEGFAQSREC